MKAALLILALLLPFHAPSADSPEASSPSAPLGDDPLELRNAAYAAAGAGDCATAMRAVARLREIRPKMRISHELLRGCEAPESGAAPVAVTASAAEAASAPQRPADAFRHAGYGRVGLGGRLVPGTSVSRQFDLGATGGLSPTAPDMWGLDLDLAVGYQSPWVLGLELGLGGGAGGSADDYIVEMRTGQGGVERTYKEGVSYGSFYAMPLLRLTEKNFFKGLGFHTLGLQVGYATLFGHLTRYDGPADPGREALISAFSTSYGLAYRYEQMLGRRMNLGLELRYQWVSFEPAYARGEKVTRLDGTPLSLDFSGPSIKLSFGFWFVRPFFDPAEAAATAARRAEKIQARRERARRSRDPRMAERLRAQADTLMEKGNPRLAAELYRLATDDDPENRQAWLGLSRALDSLGFKKEAIEAYGKSQAPVGSEDSFKILEKSKKNY